MLAVVGYIRYSIIGYNENEKYRLHVYFKNVHCIKYKYLYNHFYFFDSYTKYGMSTLSTTIICVDSHVTSI